MTSNDHSERRRRGAPASGHIVDTNGAVVHAVESGVTEPALVFLHYWGGSSRTWQSVVTRLDLAAMADDVEAVVHRFGLDLSRVERGRPSLPA